MIVTVQMLSGKRAYVFRRVLNFSDVWIVFSPLFMFKELFPHIIIRSLITDISLWSG